MAESTSKGEPQSKQFSSAELGILDKKDISRFDSEAKKILEIEQLFDELIDHEDRLTHLIERFGDEMEKGDEEGKRTKKVSKLILPEYAQRDAQIILSAIRQQHADICIKSEETLRPYLDMSSQGSRDISRVAAHRALQNEGTLDNSDDVINPGLDTMEYIPQEMPDLKVFLIV